MLGYLERVAVLSGITSVFVLSTRTMQWFVERGFGECSVSDLPETRQALYNWQRKSKVYRKELAGTREIDAEELFWDIHD
jgi:amino-acid N-acetyltransferase